jgi:hypothetical protein
MSDKASRTADPEDSALQALFRVIASRDRPMTSRLLAESPLIARLAIKVGATREGASPYYFKKIGHYAYAGDTPLHIAAAAYQRNRRGACVEGRERKSKEPTWRRTAPLRGRWHSGVRLVGPRCSICDGSVLD